MSALNYIEHIRVAQIQQIMMDETCSVTFILYNGNLSNNNNKKIHYERELFGDGLSSPLLLLLPDEETSTSSSA